MPLPPLCPMTCGGCSLGKPIIEKRLSDKPYCFVMLPYSKEFDDIEATMRAVIEGGNVFTQKYEKKEIKEKSIRVLVARDKKFAGQGMCKICQLCWFSDFGIAELATLNPNVMIEIGWLMGFGKKMILTLNKSLMNIKEIPFDLGNPMLVTYYNTIELSHNLESKVRFLLLTWFK